MTDKSDDRVEHLNTILVRGGGNLNDPIFKSSNARALPGGGGRNVEVSSRSAHNPNAEALLGGGGNSCVLFLNFQN